MKTAAWIQLLVMLLLAVGLAGSVALPMGIDFPVRGQIKARPTVVAGALTDRATVKITVMPAMAESDARPTLGGVLEFHGIEVTRALDCSYRKLISIDTNDSLPANVAAMPLNIGQELELCLH